MKPKKIKYKCLALDFDATLAYLDGGLTGFFKIFTERGIELGDIERFYRDYRNSAAGFGIEGFLKHLKNIHGIKLNEEEVNKDFAVWLEKVTKIYPDAKSFLAGLNKKIPVVIVTAGNRAFQKLKIKIVGLDYLPCLVTSPAKDKVSAVKYLIKKYGMPVLMVDDRVSELDRIRRAGLKKDKIETVLILRRESPYRKERAEYRHQKIRKLSELFIKL